MNTQQIIALQDHVGTLSDGYWGPLSEAACRKHLRSMMPAESPWPATDRESLTAFYGHAGDEDNLSMIDVTGLGIM